MSWSASAVPGRLGLGCQGVALAHGHVERGVDERLARSCRAGWAGGCATPPGRPRRFGRADCTRRRDRWRGARTRWGSCGRTPRWPSRRARSRSWEWPARSRALPAGRGRPGRCGRSPPQGRRHLGIEALAGRGEAHPVAGALQRARSPARPQGAPSTCSGRRADSERDSSAASRKLPRPAGLHKVFELLDLHGRLPCGPVRA